MIYEIALASLPELAGERARGAEGAGRGVGGPPRAPGPLRWRDERVNGLSLCSGIGGLELGLRLAIGDTYRTVGYVERDAYAAAALVARMADETLDPAPVFDDLCAFDGRPWRGRVDLISAGLPCQPYSLAGKRHGDSDERHLWPAFFRVLDEVRPALVFLENVPALLQWFRPIGERLCELGYEFEAGIFSASEVGAPHRRGGVVV